MVNCVLTRDAVRVFSHYCMHLPTKRKCNHAKRARTTRHYPLHIRTPLRQASLLHDAIGNIIPFAEDIAFHVYVLYSFGITLSRNAGL